MIFFRADANSIIGSGHIMRCLSIAYELIAKGEECLFIIADDRSAQLIANNRMPSFCLNTQWNDLDNEIQLFEKLIREKRPNAIVVDSYFVTEKYLTKMRKLAPLIYVDDLNAFTYPADIVINYNLYASQLDYRQRYSACKTKLLLSVEYTPLRREFRGVKRGEIQPQMKKVFVSTGGSDPKNMAMRLLTAIENAKSEWQQVEFHFVLGKLNPNRERIHAKACEMSNILLHENVSNMKNLIVGCDVAVSAAGSTLYEVCACGVPCITYVLADNQIQGAKVFDDFQIIKNVGDIRNNPHIEEDILRELKKLQFDQAKREQMSKKMQTVVDGFGAQRIAERIMEERKQ